MKASVIVPSTVTSLRIAVLPFFSYLFSTGSGASCMVLLGFCAATDFFDGFLARRLHATSRFGAYFDATVDFALIFGVFAVFFANGFYPSWFLALIAVSFAQFLITSLSSKILYDPVGRYLGSALLIGAALTLMWPMQATFFFVQGGFVAFFSVSLTSRFASLLHPHEKAMRTHEGQSSTDRHR